ncbi:MAG: type II toxin-antitoxin system RelE/ParE family toxin [Treponema sp.]|jgi:plasmid stabilization system protein ParE|nr:type II toxin-antitoxin system RelE/ParE family toxin [Treponema sp.]
MYSVHITDAAEEDILTTVKYIADILKAPVAANNLLDEIEKYENLLGDTPNMFSFVPDEYLRTRGIKYVTVKKYMMFFTIDEDERIVSVIRFLYGPMDWKRILETNNS